MTTIILSSLLFLTTLLSIVLYFRNKSLSNKISTFISDSKKPLRTGYIMYDLSITELGKPNISFTSLVYVNELDRYTNGESKIEIQKIEPGIEENKMQKERIEKHIKDKFKSIVKTSDVTWLESEQSIKDIRRNKLEQLKEIWK
jgi:hypothetical protein